MRIHMNELEFNEKFVAGDLDEEYAEFIMKRSCGDRMICNGDSLLVAMEENYLFDAFKQEMIE